MASPKELYYEKRGQRLVKNLQSRHFEAYYCATAQEALKKALELIPQGSSVGWGGAMTCQQIGLMDALNEGDYRTLDRAKAKNQEEAAQIMRDCLNADVFLTGANGLSLNGEMVNIDGIGNRVAAIIYGPKTVLVVVGMNKVTDDLNSALTRVRTVAAPMNMQRFGKNTPCAQTGICADCKSEDCICNQIVITRNSRPAGRIKFILVGEDLGM